MLRLDRERTLVGLVAAEVGYTLSVAAGLLVDTGSEMTWVATSRLDAV